MAKKPRYSAQFGPFVFSHPYLTKPDTEGQYADNKYKVTGITDPSSPTAKQAEKTILEALKALGLTKKADHPLKKETAKNEQGKRVPTGKLRFNTKSQYAPAIVDAAGKPIPAGALKKMSIGSGSEGLIEGFFTPYTRTEKIKDADGNIEEVETTGISFTLTGVQLIKYVPASGAGASFGAYQGGGFSYDGAASDDEDDSDTGGLSLSDDSGEDDNGRLDI